MKAGGRQGRGLGDCQVSTSRREDGAPGRGSSGFIVEPEPEFIPAVYSNSASNFGSSLHSIGRYTWVGNPALLAM